jgi:hypothetical protein
MSGYLLIIVAKYDGMNYFMDLYHNCYEYILPAFILSVLIQLYSCLEL